MVTDGVLVLSRRAKCLGSKGRVCYTNGDCHHGVARFTRLRVARKSPHDVFVAVVVASAFSALFFANAASGEKNKFAVLSADEPARLVDEGTIMPLLRRDPALAFFKMNPGDWAGEKLSRNSEPLVMAMYGGRRNEFRYDDLWLLDIQSGMWQNMGPLRPEIVDDPSMTLDLSAFVTVNAFGKQILYIYIDDMEKKGRGIFRYTAVPEDSKQPAFERIDPTGSGTLVAFPITDVPDGTGFVGAFSPDLVDTGDGVGILSYCTRGQKWYNVRYYIGEGMRVIGASVLNGKHLFLYIQPEQSDVEENNKPLPFRFAVCPYDPSKLSDDSFVRECAKVDVDSTEFYKAYGLSHKLPSSVIGADRDLIAVGMHQKSRNIDVILFFFLAVDGDVISVNFETYPVYKHTACGSDLPVTYNLHSRMSAEEPHSVYLSCFSDKPNGDSAYLGQNFVLAQFVMVKQTLHARWFGILDGNGSTPRYIWSPGAYHDKTNTVYSFGGLNSNNFYHGLFGKKYNTTRFKHTENSLNKARSIRRFDLEMRGVAIMEPLEKLMAVREQTEDTFDVADANKGRIFAPFPNARFLHSFVMGDDFIVLYGGVGATGSNDTAVYMNGDSKYLSDSEVWLYDVNNGWWHYCGSVVDIHGKPVARWGHTAELVVKKNEEGMYTSVFLHVWGGYEILRSGELNDFNSTDVETSLNRGANAMSIDLTDTFNAANEQDSFLQAPEQTSQCFHAKYAPVGLSPRPRVLHASAKLGDNIFIHGGCGKPHILHNSKTKADLWDLLRCQKSDTLGDIWRYDTQELAWSQLSALVDGPPLYGHAIAPMHKRTIFVFGGTSGFTDYGVHVVSKLENSIPLIDYDSLNAVFFRFDTGLEEWAVTERDYTSGIGVFPPVRGFHSMVSGSLSNGTLVIFGGDMAGRHYDLYWTYMPACSAGSYSSDGSIDDCTLCAKGTFSDVDGGTACIPCLGGASTKKIGSTKYDECTECMPGFCANGGECFIEDYVARCKCAYWYYGTQCTYTWAGYVFITTGTLLLFTNVSAVVIYCLWKRLTRRTLAVMDMFNRKYDLLYRIEDEKWAISSRDVEIVQKVGAGASAVVYKAKWNGITVAAKQFFDEFDMSAFNREVQILRRLHHPNLLRLWGATVRPLTIVTEYCAEGNLATVYRNRRALADMLRRTNVTLDDFILSVAEGICRGMSHLHEQKPPIIHRDLKPDNILLTDTGEVKISDFGLSRPTIGALTGGQGTLCYMAPEVITAMSPGNMPSSNESSESHFGASRAAETPGSAISVHPLGEGPAEDSTGDVLEYSLPADVFSFAMVLFELVTGYQPFHQEKWPHAIADKIVAGERPCFPEVFRLGTTVGRPSTPHGHGPIIELGSNQKRPSSFHKKLVGKVEDCGDLEEPLIPTNGSNSGHDKLEVSVLVKCELRHLVEACWASEPSQRPTFRDIVQRLNQLRVTCL